MQRPLFISLFSILACVQATFSSARHFGRTPKPRITHERDLYQEKYYIANEIRDVLLDSLRLSWEQGVGASAILEMDNPEYSVFGKRPFEYNGNVPKTALRFALSAAVRQSEDGRLCGDHGQTALDAASAGSVVLLGSFTDPSRKELWEGAAAAQLDYLLNVAPKTSTGAISHRTPARQYWSDGVYVGFPFIAYYGAVTQNEELLLYAYTNCKLYRDALRFMGPTGYLWRHVYDDDNQEWVDEGLWATGNAWAALGMLRISMTISKSSYASTLAYAIEDLNMWTKEILDNIFAAVGPDNLVPNYVYGHTSFGGDAAASAAIVSVAYRAATYFPDTFGSNYTAVAAKVRDAVIAGIDNLGVLSPVVDPLRVSRKGILSPEAQSFALMMFAAWRDYEAAGTDRVPAVI